MVSANILIVEDEMILAEDLKDTLLDLGYRVAGSVGSGQAAIDIASKNDVELVLMDIKIDGELDGIDTAKTLQNRFRIPVIDLTAFSDDAIVQRAKETEPFGYIVKPDRTSEIKAVLEIALFKVKREEERQASYHHVKNEAQLQADQLEDWCRIKSGMTCQEFLDFISFSPPPPYP
jgi:AmiR/NasT family two-component response regulator